MPIGTRTTRHFNKGYVCMYVCTAWQSRNGNKNFLTWNKKFRSDQTDRSKRTTCGSGPLWPQAAQEQILFIFIHSLINSKSNELPQSVGSLCFDQKISTWKEATEISETFSTMERNPTSRSKTRGLETVILGNGYSSYAHGRFHCS